MRSMFSGDTIKVYKGIPNPGVERSNRSGGTKKINDLGDGRVSPFSLHGNSLPTLSPLFQIEGKKKGATLPGHPLLQSNIRPVCCPHRPPTFTDG